MEPKAVTEDMRAEHEDLDSLVGPLSPEQWALPTPSPGWTIAHQIAHLTYFDRTAAQAISDPEGFTAHRDELVDSVLSGEIDADSFTLGELLELSPADLLSAWREGREELIRAAEGLGAGDRVEWYGPSMGAASFLTARLMETWAHGQDIADALEVERVPTDRLTHIARLGIITRGWSYSVRGAEVPATPVSVELRLPGGEVLKGGNPEASDRIAGPAEHFCLVVTQRRHVEDTDLEVVGTAAREWMEVAQAFAGGATDGPPPGGWSA